MKLRHLLLLLLLQLCLKANAQTTQSPEYASWFSGMENSFKKMIASPENFQYDSLLKLIGTSFTVENPLFNNVLNVWPGNNKLVEICYAGFAGLRKQAALEPASTQTDVEYKKKLGLLCDCMKTKESVWDSGNIWLQQCSSIAQQHDALNGQAIPFNFYNTWVYCDHVYNSITGHDAYNIVPATYAKSISAIKEKLVTQMLQDYRSKNFKAVEKLFPAYKKYTKDLNAYFLKIKGAKSSFAYGGMALVS